MPKARVEKKLGIDIGSYAIKLVELHLSKDENRVASIGIKRIENSSPEALAGKVRELCEESKVKTRDVSLSVSGPQVITRLITMPTMSDSEMKNALVFEVEKTIPFSPEEVIYDYQVLERGKEKKMDVLLTAVKRDYVQKYIQIAQSSDLSLRVVDVDSLALANAFVKNSEGSLDQNKTVALLNIGDRYTNLDILRGGVLSFSRDIQIGGRDVNESIARILNVDSKGAEKLKFDPKERADEIGLPIRMVLANLADELRLSFGYFENRFGRNVDDLYLSGGSCGLLGVTEYLEENLGLKAKVWDPLKAFSIDQENVGKALSNEMRRSLAVSVGLALR